MNAIKSYIQTALRIAEEQFGDMQYKPEYVGSLELAKLYAIVFGLRSLMVLFDD